MVISKPGREVSPETILCGILILDFWTSDLQKCEEISFCCLSNSVSGISLWPLTKAREDGVGMIHTAILQLQYLQPAHCTA